MLEDIGKLPLIKKIIHRGISLVGFIYSHSSTLSLLRQFTNKRELVRHVARPRPPSVPRASCYVSEATFQATMGKMFARQEDICDSQQAVRRSTRCLMDNLHKLSLDVLDTPDDYLMNGAQFDEYISWLGAGQNLSGGCCCC